MSTIFDFNGAPSAGWSQPDPRTDDPLSGIGQTLRRASLPRWPRASEPELVRHYTLLSQKNFGIDTGFVHRASTLIEVFWNDQPIVVHPPWQ